MSQSETVSQRKPISRSRMRDKKQIIALVILVLAVLGLAHHIEITARPPTNRQGVHVGGESGHSH